MRAGSDKVFSVTHSRMFDMAGMSAVLARLNSGLYFPGI
jgi:hypothetical protein